VFLYESDKNKDTQIKNSNQV